MKGNVFEDLVAGLQKADASRARMWLVPKQTALPSSTVGDGLNANLNALYRRMSNRAPEVPAASSIITPINWGVVTLLDPSERDPYRVTYP
jgi:hypothetical protein